MAAPVWEKVFQTTNNAIFSVVIIVITECFFFNYSPRNACWITEIEPQQLTENVGKHLLTYHFASLKTKCFRESGWSVTECVSITGHPGTLLSSQVVAIQWYLLQGRMLVFVWTHDFLSQKNSEHVCTCVFTAVEFQSAGSCDVWFWWKHAQSCQLSKDSAIIWQNPAYSLHMHVSDL